jgi:cytochrome c oxidase subunit 2
MSLEEAGAQLYNSKACVTCHSIDGTAGVAPSFLGKFGTIEKLADGSEIEVDENYLRESILNPQAKIVQGYQPVMPTYQGVLKDRQIDALIAYIKSLKK